MSPRRKWKWPRGVWLSAGDALTRVHHATDRLVWCFEGFCYCSLWVTTQRVIIHEQLMKNNYFLRLKTKEKNMKMDERLKQAIWKNLIWKVLISNYESPFILFQQLSRILSLSALATLPKTQIMFTQTMATDGQSRLILLGIRFTRNANADCLTQHKF